MPSQPRSSRLLVAVVSALLALPLAAALPPAPAHAAPTTLTGTVEDALEALLPGVTVEPRDLVTNSPVPGRSVTTGADGDYALSLEPGDYRIWFVETGYTPEPYGGADDPTTVTVTSAGGVVLDGDPQEDGDLGRFTLQATATRTVSGTVTAGGAGYGGVTVRAYAEDDDETVVASTTTAGNGGYGLVLPLGRYHLELVAPIASPQYATTFLGGNDTPTLVTVSATDVPLGATALALAANQTFPIVGRAVDANGEGVNGLTATVSPIGAGTTVTGPTAGTDAGAGAFSVSVPPGSYQVSFSGSGFVDTSFPGAGVAASTVTVAPNGGLSANGTELPTRRLEDVEVPSTGRPVSGRVTTIEGTGLPGLTVRATPVEGDGSPVSATSGADGAYTLQVPIGSWTVDVTDDDGTSPQYAGTPVAGGKVVRVDQDGTFAVDGTMVSALPDQPLSEATPHTAYAVLGDLTDANGDPVTGVTVTATGGAMVVESTSSAEGRYSLPLRPGSYRVRTAATAAFAATDYTHETATAVDVVVSSAGTVTVDADGAGPALPAEVPGRLLKPIELAGLQTTVVTGRAVAAGPTPLAGITAKGLAASDTSVVGGTSGQTGADGTYALALRIGTYVVELTDTNGTDPTYSRVFLGGTTDPEAATEVKVAQGGVVSVRGTVLTSGLPDTTMTAADGSTAHAVRGTVSDVNGDPLAGVVVSAPGRPTAVTDNEGRYTLQLPEGSYSPLTFSKDQFATRSYPHPDDDALVGTVTVSRDGTITVVGGEGPVADLGDVELSGTTTYPVSGTVRGAGNADPGRITVQVADDNAASPFADAATTSSAGAFAFARTIGTYRIQFVDGDGAAPLYARTGYPTRLKIAQGGALFLDDVLVASLPGLTLPVVPAGATYVLVGTVSDWDGNALDGVTVEALDPATGAVRARTTSGPDPAPQGSNLGDAGVYRMPVQAGRYWMRYSKPGHQTTYLSSWEDDADRLVITVSADGRITTTEDDVIDLDDVITDVTLYDPAPVLRKRPVLQGRPAAGQTVTASLGSWDVGNVSTWAYVEWFLDGKAADHFSSGKLSERFEVPARAVGRALSFRLSLDDPDGRRASTSVASKPVKVRPAKPRLTVAAVRGALRVKVSLKGVAKLTGRIAVLDGARKIAKATLSAKSKGRATLRLRGLRPGRHKLVVVFDGPAGYRTVKEKVTVTIS